MRHNKKFNHLGRTADHRAAMLANLAISLIMHKRITTTLAKAKALKKYVEPLITKSKEDSTNSRRVVFSYLQNKEALKELFGVVAAKVGDRPGDIHVSSSWVYVRVTLLLSASSSSLTLTRTWPRPMVPRRRALVVLASLQRLPRLPLPKLLPKHLLPRLLLLRKQRLNNICRGLSKIRINLPGRHIEKVCLFSLSCSGSHVVFQEPSSFAEVGQRMLL